MASTWLVEAGAGQGTAMAAATTQYVPLLGGLLSITTTEAVAQILIRDTYTGSNLWVRCTANASDGTTTIRTRKGAANGAQSVTFATTVTGIAEDTVNTDAMATGELWNYSFNNAGSSGNANFSIASVLLQHSGTGTFPLAFGDASPSTQGENLVRYVPFGGADLLNATEANTQYTFRVAATFNSFRVYVSTNSIGANTVAKTRKNGADGGQSVTITASTTGSYEDTVNTDSIAAGDEVNGVIDSTSAKMGSLAISVMQVEAVATGRQLIASGSVGVGQATSYITVEGSAVSNTATEGNTQADARTALTIANMYAYVSANTRAANTVVAFRKNGASAGPTVTFGSSVTGVQEDTVNTTTVADGDLINYSVDGTAAAGTTTFQILGVESQQGAGGTAIDGAVKGVGILAATLVPNIPITAALQRYNYTWA